MKSLILTIVIIISISQLYAQSTSPEVIATSGDLITGTGGSLSYTVGEPVTETIIDEDMLTQGFQQPKFSVSFIEETVDWNHEVKVYPVPTSNYIHIEFGKRINDMMIEVFDIQGKGAFSRAVTSSPRRRCTSPCISSIFSLLAATSC